MLEVNNFFEFDVLVCVCFLLSTSIIVLVESNASAKEEECFQFF